MCVSLLVHECVCVDVGVCIHQLEGMWVLNVQHLRCVLTLNTGHIQQMQVDLCVWVCECVYPQEVCVCVRLFPKQITCTCDLNKLQSECNKIIILRQ